MYGYNLLLGEAVVMKRISKVNKGGFTLIEIMLVVAILVILASLSYISITESLNRHRNTQAAAESKFKTQVQADADYVRHSMLSGTPHYSGSAAASS